MGSVTAIIFSNQYLFTSWWVLRCLIYESYTSFYELEIIHSNCFAKGQTWVKFKINNCKSTGDMKSIIVNKKT